MLCLQVDGATVVWDLKKQRPVITLKDPNRCGWQQAGSNYTAFGKLQALLVQQYCWLAVTQSSQAAAGLIAIGSNGDSAVK
jgi:hypothetical protein